jgi:hypothetical protein
LKNARKTVVSTTEAMPGPSSSIPDLLEKTLSKITESETQTPVTIPSPDCPGRVARQAGIVYAGAVTRRVRKAGDHGP